MAQVNSADGPALEIRNLSFKYPNTVSQGKKNAGDATPEYTLDNINYTLPQGAMLAVLGPNGGGKTTLLRLILGFLRPDSGNVKIFGVPPESAREYIGYVPQFCAARADFPATVEEVVLMGAASGKNLSFLEQFQYWKTDGKQKKKASDLLERLGLSGYAKRQLAELSGGERQRTLIARALMGWREDQPFILLLDEPTASVDPAGKFCFYDFLYSLKGRITSILVSHDLSAASGVFSHLVVVNRSLIEASPKGSGLGAQRLLAPLRGSSGLESVLGRHEHDFMCPVGEFIKAAAPEEKI